ncbi:hypothetical protein MMH89_04090 [Candidatus Comchoanobacter bicostacola]|uniref:Uncharacterized protein n=1 Tax=Candidatus Comchoanobacter bicostacola TaxID=2919598 RepID=A0ABY5DK80_9GAMM|nr:hypothetical protein [Candidatus Comchoanobacter bicostacola]UTC24398.1 hypothetical protein MMH89_04090 [Candidatus Comchoanobacter bicostacola]
MIIPKKLKYVLLNLVLSTVPILHAQASGCANAVDGTIGKVFCNIKDYVLKGVLILIYASSIILGIGLFIAALFKMKQVKDNPTQIPVSTPFALLAAGAMMFFIPEMFPVIKDSVYGEGSSEEEDPQLSLVGLLDQ